METTTGFLAPYAPKHQFCKPKGSALVGAGLDRTEGQNRNRSRRCRRANPGIVMLNAESGRDAQVDRFQLHGQTAVVTGGHRGLGRAISIGIAQAGADVIVVDLNGPNMSDVPEIVHALGRKHFSVQCNLADGVATKKAAREAAAAAGENGVDILVNNAGVALLGRLEEMSTAEWDSTMATNLRAAFVMARELVGGEEGMLARGRGVVVNVSSAAGSTGLESHAAYSASKAGLEQLTRTMTAEWAGRGIRANAVAPTVVMTEMGQRVWGGTAAGAEMLKKVPQGRFAEEREIADVVVFLCSQAASMVNGVVVPVDGGYCSM